MEAPTITPISGVPGLFISDSRQSATVSQSSIKKNNIMRILSLGQPHEASSLTSSSQAGTPTAFKTIAIDDDEMIDIMQYLEDECDWIRAGLQSKPDGHDTETQPGVLVYCRRGTRLSGAFVVAYIMRQLSLPYSSALSMARSSCPSITPNPGFERQLRIWEHCRYAIYQTDLVDNTKQSVGPANKDSKNPAFRKIKPAYKAYLAERDNLLKRGEEDINRARLASMASMVALFGRRRMEMESEAETETESLRHEASQPPADAAQKALSSNKIAAEKKRRDSWARVEMMEKEWNARLMGGELG